jgi:hypothetical protein
LEGIELVDGRAWEKIGDQRDNTWLVPVTALSCRPIPSASPIPSSAILANVLSIPPLAHAPMRWYYLQPSKTQEKSHHNQKETHNDDQRNFI